MKTPLVVCVLFSSLLFILGCWMDQSSMDSVVSIEDGHVECRNTADHQESNKMATLSAGKKSSETTLLSCIGCHEYFSSEMWRAALTELVATASLMFTLTTSIISCLDSNGPNPKLTVPFAVFIIAYLFLMVTVPLTGGHMSPVFTIIAALKGVISFARASIYILAQCIGSIIGFLIIKSVMNHQEAHKYSLGGCSIHGDGSSGLSPTTALILEFSCTFVVLFIGVTVAFDKRRCKELGLALVCAVVAGAMALVVFVSITVTGQSGYAGVGLNPARCLGPALLEGGELWYGHWVFWVGPVLACTIYYGFTLTLPREGLVWVEGEYGLLRFAGACLGVENRTLPLWNSQSKGMEI